MQQLSPDHRFQYRPEIDGLRAVAVLPVILFHAGFGVFSGGFIGVDVFFVISGYLITSLIRQELSAGTFTLARFYERRARRILPALFAMVLACLPAAWFFLTPRELRSFADSVFGVATFTSNIHFWLKSGYFGPAVDLLPLLHTWSLAVEEQYYIVFPVLLLVLSRFARSSITLIFAGLAATSLLAAQWTAHAHPDAAFYLLPFRGWELLLGALLALQERLRLGITTGQLLSMAGLAMIAFSVLLFNEDSPFPGLPALLPAGGAALVIFAARDGTAVQFILSQRWIVGVGLISYSLYLWHQPIFVFARRWEGSDLTTFTMLALCAFSFPVAWLSWRFIEKPFRQKGLIAGKFVWTFAGTTVFALIALSLVTKEFRGFERYYFAHRLTVTERGNYELILKHSDYDVYKTMYDDGKCRFWAQVVDAEFAQRFEQCARTMGQAVVVIGDSHAMNLFNIVSKSDVAPFVAGIAQGGCRPQEEKPKCHYGGVLAFANTHRTAIRIAIFHQSGSYFITDQFGHANSQRAFLKGAKYGFDTAAIRKAVNYVQALKGFVPIYWVGPFPESRVELTSKPMLRGDFRMNPQSLKIFAELETYMRTGPLLDEALDDGVYVPFSQLRKIDEQFLRVGDCITYRDSNHFSRCGEDIIATNVAAAFSPTIAAK